MLDAIAAVVGGKTTALVQFSKAERFKLVLKTTG